MKRFVLALVLGAYSLSAQAALTVFNSESDFLATAPIVSTETFDGFATGPLTNDREIVIDDVTYRIIPTGECPLFGACWSASTLGAVSLPNKLRSGDVPWADHVIGFGSNRFVEAFGFFLTSPERTITINETDGNSLVIDVNSAMYFGFQSDIGIRDIVVAGLPSSTVAFGVDNVSRSEVVPVPAAVWLFGSALGLLGWMHRTQIFSTGVRCADRN